MNADLFISNYVNAGGGKGSEVYCSRVGGTSRECANVVATALAKTFYNRGVKVKIGDDGRDYYHVIRETKMPAILIEHGFIDNSSDASILSSDANLKKLARDTVDAIRRIAPATPTQDSNPNSSSEKTVYINTVIKYIQDLEKMYIDFLKIYGNKPLPSSDSRENILSYLRTLNPTYNTKQWQLTAGVCPPQLEDYIKENNLTLYNKLNTIFCESPSVLVYDKSNHYIDISHMIATADGYFRSPWVPDSWTGWAGDLATAMNDAEILLNEHDYITAMDAARDVIGNENYSCGITDLRADADAIEIAKLLKSDGSKKLSEALTNYYTYTYLTRFNVLIKNIGSESTLEQDVKKVMDEALPSFILKSLLAKNPSNSIIEACCKVFASYCISRKNTP